MGARTEPSSISLPRIAWLPHGLHPAASDDLRATEQALSTSWSHRHGVEALLLFNEDSIRGAVEFHPSFLSGCDSMEVSLRNYAAYELRDDGFGIINAPSPDATAGLDQRGPQSRIVRQRRMGSEIFALRRGCEACGTAFLRWKTARNFPRRPG